MSGTAIRSMAAREGGNRVGQRCAGPGQHER